MRHVVMCSGGGGSYAAAKKLTKTLGSPPELLFADTLIEDEDLYRFLVESCADILGLPGAVAGLRGMLGDIPPLDALDARKVHLSRLRASACAVLPGLHWIADGRTPWEVFRDEKFVGNTRVASCSHLLKQDTSRAWLETHCLPAETTIYLGIHWSEMDRFTGNKAKKGARDLWLPWKCRAPLCELPFEPYLQMFVDMGAAGIAKPRLYEMGFAHNNCFSGDTRFLTDQGVKSLSETAGTSVVVRGFRGDWQQAEVKSFGIQSLLQLSLQRYGRTKIIHTTAGHRWVVRKGRSDKQDKLTTELKVGDAMVSLYGKTPASIRPSAFGIARGIAYGDGTHSTTNRTPDTVVLCGEKAKDLVKWFPLSPRLPVKDVGIRVSDLPRDWKTPPRLDESLSVLYGWLAGYFAADGSVSNSSIVLSSASRDCLALAQNVALQLGIGCESIRSYTRRGYGREPSTVYSVAFVPSTMREDFFLRDKHLKAFMLADKKRPAEWKVAGVTTTDRKEEVFCAVVPGGHVFTLEDNILTGNCGGFCVKGGHKQFKLLLEKLPERFLYHEGQEQAMRELLGKDVSILRNRRGGSVKPLPMADLRKRVENDDMTEEELCDFGGCGCFSSNRNEDLGEL